MAYKAIIQSVEKTEDEIIINVEFVDGDGSFSKKYPFLHVNDLNTIFDQTIQTELKRINDLTTNYTTVKAREGEEILFDEEK